MKKKKNQPRICLKLEEHLSLKHFHVFCASLQLSQRANIPIRYLYVQHTANAILCKRYGCMYPQAHRDIDL